MFILFLLFVLAAGIAKGIERNGFCLINCQSCAPEIREPGR